MYTVSKLTDNIYTLAADDLVEVARYSGVTLIASYDKIHQAFTYTDAEAFAAKAADGEEEPRRGRGGAVETRGRLRPAGQL